MHVKWVRRQEPNGLETFPAASFRTAPDTGRPHPSDERVAFHIFYDRGAGVDDLSSRVDLR